MMIRPDKVYEDIVSRRLVAKGDLVAWRGKIATGDSREAYVTRGGVPIRSFWYEADAVRFVRNETQNDGQDG